MISKIVVPNIGATRTGVTLIEWFVKPGEYVKAGAPLFSVSTDRVKVEAFRDGYVRELIAHPGSHLELGADLG